MINVYTDNDCYLDDTNLPEISPIFKRRMTQVKKITDMFVFYRMCQRSSKELCTNKQKISKKGNLPNLLTDVRKYHSTQQSGKKVQIRDVNHSLLTAKLGAYGFDTKTINHIKIYLDNRKQRVCVNSNFSSWQEIIAGVMQGSILGTVLFNVFLNGLFFCPKFQAK